MRMTKLEELEKSVSALARDEMDQFADWFDQFRAAQWDTQIEIDGNNPNLNALADAALTAHRRGQTTFL
jgi:hypothetical protein